MNRLEGKKILYVQGLCQKKGSIVVCESGIQIEYPWNSKLLIKRLCKQYGLCYEYQRKLSQRVINGSQKIPIVIREGRQCILFPVANIEQKQTIWMNYEMIQSVKARYYYFTDVYFYGGAHFCIRQNERIIKNQIIRCKKLMLFLERL